jgi:hypothetical protein
MWMVAAALALGGCADLCSPNRTSADAFAPTGSFGREISACIQQRDCAPLCIAVFQLDHPAESCTIVSAVHDDLTTQPAPIPPSIDMRTIRGMKVHAVYVQGPRGAACDAESADWWDFWDDGSTDDSDDGSCDDGSCGGNSGDDGSCDDGSCDGGGDSGGSGDDGSGGSGGSGDGSGDDGDPARAPTGQVGSAATGQVGSAATGPMSHASTAHGSGHAHHAGARRAVHR